MPAARRSTNTNGAPKDVLRALKRENQLLRRKLKEAEQQCRRAVQAWAKAQITPKEIAAWEREIKRGAKGGSLQALIDELATDLRHG